MVDAVYTWVDGSDLEWLQRKNAALDELPDSETNVVGARSDSRYHNRDELKYSLRSLGAFAPFIDKIFIVTDGQIPGWLDTSHPKIKLVFHHELFDNPQHLPTFNSHAIEANLHRINGLSEQFIYLNDDFAFFRRAKKSDFFDSRGRAVVYFDHRKVTWNSWWFGYNAPVNSAARNNSHLLHSLTNSKINYRLDHVPYALHKSVIEELWSLFPDQMSATSSHRFRNTYDLSVASSLAQHYALATHRAVKGPLNTNAYIKIKKYPLSGVLTACRLMRLRMLPPRNCRFVSINDAGQLDQSNLTQSSIAKFLDTCYPEKSQFERRQA